MFTVSYAISQQTFGATLISSLPQLLSTIVGGLVGLTAAWITNRSAIKRMQLEFDERHTTAKKDKTRERADELYTMFSAWSKTIASHHMLTIPAWTGVMKYNDLLDAQGKSLERFKDRYDFERVEMLTTAFFPRLLPEFAKVITARDVLAKRDSRLRIAHRSSRFQPESSDDVLRELEAFNHASERLKKQIVQEIIKLQ